MGVHIRCLLVDLGHGAGVIGGIDGVGEKELSLALGV
jgi:hypothetical protein